MTISRDTNDWRAIAKWAEGEIAKAHRLLEVPGTPDTTTDNLRGRIGSLRDLLRLPDRQAEPPAVSPLGTGLDDYSPIDTGAR